MTFIYSLTNSGTNGAITSQNQDESLDMVDPDAKDKYVYLCAIASSTVMHVYCRKIIINVQRAECWIHLGALFAVSIILAVVELAKTTQ